jgi:hypothetical protein
VQGGGGGVKPASYFVYVSAGKHLWRFVFFAAAAEDGDDAIRQAWAEAVEMGSTPEGSYMAVPFSAITTTSTVSA